MLAVGEFVMDIYYLSSIWMHLPVKDLELSNTVQANYQDKQQKDDGEGKKQMLEGHGHFKEGLRAMKLGFAELFSFFSSKKAQNTMPCGCFLLTTSVPLI